jgi:L-alanine-DL-glutamate epimerase-like enolase superfamily enzyme
MSLSLSVETKFWRLREPFVISRGMQTEIETVVVTLTAEDGHRGRGEGCGVRYAGETPRSMSEQIEYCRSRIETGIDRQGLLSMLPPGGARCAVDAALWDLESKRIGQSAFMLAGIANPHPVTTAYTIGIRSIAEYELTAHARRQYPLLKIKVDDRCPIAAVEAARRGAPGVPFIVDPNQAWSVADLKGFADELLDLGVVLIEHPIKVGEEAQLEGYRCPVRLCADELIDGPADLPKARGRFDVINIKLDKTGGLTAALGLAVSAREAGFELMVGCMVGSSLSMAPAVVLAQQCAFVDLDGPLLQAEDWPGGLSYSDGVIELPARDFWG